MGTDAVIPPPAADDVVHLLAPDRSFVRAAARWLVERFDADALGQVLVAVPGSRARALLLDACAVALSEAGRSADAPPEVLTAGQLGDRLARPTPTELEERPGLAAAQRPAASRALRSLIWQRAVAALSPARRALLLPRSAETPEALRAAAASLRALHAELARADRDAVDLLEALEAQHPDRRRWELFEELRRSVLEQLSALGIADPHELRRRSTELPARGFGDVVLVGVIDPDELGLLLEAQLAHRVSRRYVLLPGDPASGRPDHDPVGRVDEQRVLATERGLDLERWRLVPDPPAGARRVRDWLAEQSTSAFSPTARRVGLCLRDPDVLTHLRGVLRPEGLGLRELAGRRWTRGPAGRLLQLIAAHLEAGEFRDLAALVRHSVVDALLARLCERGGRVLAAAPAALLDDYHAAHLPRGRPRSWSRSGRGGPERAEALEAVEAALGAWLGEFARDEELRPAAHWAAELRRLLGACFEEVPEAAALSFRPEVLAPLLEQLEILESWPAAAPELRGPECLALLLESLAARSVSAEPSGAALPVMAFEDLLFEDVDALLLAGFEAARLPVPTRRHAWLDDQLASDLGLPGDDARLAHAFWVLRACQARGVELELLGSRRGTDGEPRLPSRLAFLGSEAQALAAAERVWGRASDEPEETLAATSALPELPLLAESAPPLKRLSVTGFGSYLSSPYGCYLEHVLGVRAVHDRAREMDALVFGNLAHDVLQAFGEEGHELQGDESGLCKLLESRLDQHVAQLFGRTPFAAVRVQVEQLRARLRRFASQQLKWYAKGWRLVPEYVEWKPAAGGVSLDVDGEPIFVTGRIDRIDHNEQTGEWALLDYKTGEKASRPAQAHGPSRDGRWRSLQLPLYRLLVAELKLEGTLRTGLVSLPADPSTAGFRLDEWEPEQLEHAQQTACEIVRRLRSGDVRALGAGFGAERAPGFAALSGAGLMGGPAERRPEVLVPLGDDAGDENDEGAS